MISSLQLNLLVIRSAEPARLAEFYSLLGLKFVYHQHGTKGTWHYSANAAKLVFEIYPQIMSLMGAAILVYDDITYDPHLTQ